MRGDFSQSGGGLPPVWRDDLADAVREVYHHFVDPNGTTYLGIWGPRGLGFSHKSFVSRLDQHIEAFFLVFCEVIPIVHQQNKATTQSVDYFSAIPPKVSSFI